MSVKVPVRRQLEDETGGSDGAARPKVSSAPGPENGPLSVAWQSS